MEIEVNNRLETWPVIRSKPVPKAYGRSISIFINNAQCHLTTVDVYEDGSIDCWGFVDRNLFRKKVQARWVVPSPKAGQCLSVHNFGFSAIADGCWFQSPESILIVTSERCLLTMLLPARELRTSLVPNLHASLRSLLERLAVPQEQVSRELDGMQPVSFARATNRRVLGSMNDLAFQASHHLAHGDDLATLAERLAHTPMSAIAEGSGHLGFPDLLARALLAAGVG